MVNRIMKQSKPAYKIKCLNKDFVVSEVPIVPDLVSPARSKYSYLWVEKSGFTTFEVQDEIKNYFGLDYSGINVEGLKDEDAITSQLFSIKKIISDSQINKFNKNTRCKKGFVKITKIIGTGKKPARKGVCLVIPLK